MAPSFSHIARSSVVVGTLLLAACYPELDWREIISESGRYAVLMPAQPEHARREIVVGGVALAVSMNSARKEGMAFGAAHAEIPGGDVRPAALLAAARDALVKNIDGRLTADREVTIDGATGREFFAEGSANGQPMQLAARVFTDGSRFYQVVFVGRSNRLTAADVSLFLGSFRLKSK